MRKKEKKTRSKFEPVRERYAAGSPEHRGARIDIRCTAEIKEAAERLASRREVSVSELFRVLVDEAS